MTTTPFSSRLIQGLLSVRPLAAIAKHQARRMIINRAESLGIPWRQEVERLRSQQPQWEEDLAEIRDSDVTYPDYFCQSFHAYDEGNLGWMPAFEVDVAAQAVHARLWPEEGRRGDLRLRQEYHQVLQAHLPQAPRVSVDLGCSCGASTAALQEAFPESQAVGIDLSPYFLVIARQNFPDAPALSWRHAAAEATRLEPASVDSGLRIFAVSRAAAVCGDCGAAGG